MANVFLLNRILSSTWTVNSKVKTVRVQPVGKTTKSKTGNVSQLGRTLNVTAGIAKENANAVTITTGSTLITTTSV